MVEDETTKQVKSKLGNPNIAEEGKPYHWKPGESGNPGGRKKDPGITASQIEMLDKPCPYAKDPKMTWREWLAEKGLILATQKEMALEHLKERLEGKVRQDIGIEGIEKVEVIEKVKDYGG